jgi:hypothetical protein
VLRQANDLHQAAPVSKETTVDLTPERTTPKRRRRQRPDLPYQYWKTREYNSWCSMRNRCSNPNNIGFANYGGRGVTVCERWADFAAFLADMGPRPDGHTLDRIDPDGNYEPGNCRWVTRLEQRHNRSQFLRPEQIPVDQRWPGDWDEIGLSRKAKPRTLAHGVGDNPEEQRPALDQERSEEQRR